MDENKDFCYWKYPWQKWCPLVAAGLQLLLLWANFREYRSFSQIPPGVLNPELLASHLDSLRIRCVLNAAAAVLFFAPFLIGCLSKTPLTARRWETALLLAFTLIWAAVFPLMNGTAGGRALWLILLLVSLGASAWGLWKHWLRKTA